MHINRLGLPSRFSNFSLLRPQRLPCVRGGLRYALHECAKFQFVGKRFACESQNSGKAVLVDMLCAVERTDVFLAKTRIVI